MKDSLLLGTAFGAGLSLVVVGWFVRAGARFEEGLARAHDGLEHATVADVMTRNPLVLPAWLDAGELVDTRPMRSEEAFPVQDRDGTLLGIVSARQLRLAARARRGATCVADVMRPLSGLRTFGPGEPATALLEPAGPDGDGLSLVLDSGHLVGTVRQHDLAHAVSRRRVTRPRSPGSEAGAPFTPDGRR